jgi:hypothetical protein
MSEVRLYLGKRGSGKTTAMRGDLDGEPRIVVYDTLHEAAYDDFHRIDDIGDLADRLIANPPIIRLAYTWNGKAARDVDFDRVCAAVYCCRNLVFAIDEVDLFCSPNFTPRHLDMIVSLGRHRGLSVYCATRRPKEIPATIRAQAARVISFRQSEPADLEWCRQVMGAMADRLPGLAEYQRLTWDDRDPLDNGADPVVED